MISQDQAVGVLDCAVSGDTKVCQPTCAVQLQDKQQAKLSRPTRCAVACNIEPVGLGIVIGMLRNVV